jgi:hypothetical protein
MRNLIIVLLISLLAGSCKTYSYFNSSNDLSNEYCQVFLADGKEIDGKLTIQFETGHEADRHVKIHTADNTDKQVLITDIQYYKYKEEYYFPKETNLEAYLIPYTDKLYTPEVNNLVFMKRVTKADAKMQLFQLFKSKINTSDGTDQYDYYIALNNDNRFMGWNIRGKRFFPNFEEKMSTMVSDCSALSEKIKQKKKGYAVKQLSVDLKKYEVVKRIVDEYNSCK